MLIAQTPIAEAINHAASALAKAGCDSPETDARALLDAAVRAQAPRPKDMTVLGSAASQFAHSIKRRTEREPLEYILGTCTFRGLTLAVDARVVVPDPPTAILVELTDRLRPGMRVHEIGAGCAAVCLATKHEHPDLVVTASDISPEAVDVGQANARQLGLDVDIFVADGCPEQGAPYDMILANLPYVDTALRELNSPPEFTRWQPNVGIFAGADGLTIIRRVVSDLRTSALVALQHAPSQTELVRALFDDDPETLGDGGRYSRFTVGRLRENPQR